MESVTLQVVADYFLYMFHKLDRKVSTIESHRTALSAALGTFEGYSVGNHPVLTNLIKNLWQERPQTRIRNPDWDVCKVLTSLMGPPFEPPRFDTPEQKKFTSWKTCFLLAFAKTCRASELSAFSRDERDLIFQKTGVWMRTIPRFLPKTQAPSVDPKPFFLPSHEAFTGRDTPDRLLCPVRMLKYYLKFTNGHANEEPLFRKCKGEGNVGPQTISNWLKHTVEFVYNGHKKPIVKGHEVRKLSASWVFASGSQLHDILAAGSWSRQSTFTSHYLVDVQRQFSGKFRLTPVVCHSKSH